MASKKEKGFRKANRNHIWSAMVFILIMMAALHAFLVGVSSIVLRYVVDSRVMDEYRSVSYMADLYESGVGDAETLLNKEGRDYVIADENGKILYQYGKNTCSMQKTNVKMYSYPEAIVFCTDTEMGFVHPTGSRLTIDLEGFLKWLRLTYASTDMEQDEDDDNLNIELPFWISVSMRDGRESLYGKGNFRLDKNDVLLVIILAAAFVVLTFFMLVLLIVYIIGSLSRQHKMTTLFFMDEVTRNRNWLWFQIRSELTLKRRRNAKNRYAVLDVVIMKYRNFCMRHSIAEGEQVLIEVDRILNKNINRQELCAHYASANFAVLLKYTERGDLMARVEELIKKLEYSGGDYKFRFHIGINPVPVATDHNGRPVRRTKVDVEKEYNNACAARATLENNDESAIAFFDDKLMEEQKWIGIVEEEQQAALENEEFEVYYQPKYDPRTEKLTGAEALIRWNSPKYGFKGPGSFIPIFEKNGFITKIDHYMVRHVARDQKRWLDEGRECVPVSVNVSRAHFTEEDLAEQIRDMVDEAGTPHELVEIELTESAFFDDKNAIIRTIRKLKEFGFTVSMDDFGSGYSSLNSLKDMPLDVLKLDAEFFRSSTDDERSEIVISEAIRLAKNLNMRTVAEGIEVKDQVDFLADQGCDMIQGFFFAKPMPKADYEKRMGTVAQ